MNTSFPSDKAVCVWSAGLTVASLGSLYLMANPGTKRKMIQRAKLAALTTTVAAPLGFAVMAPTSATTTATDLACATLKGAGVLFATLCSALAGMAFLEDSTLF
jgi:hypothetical protein